MPFDEMPFDEMSFNEMSFDEMSFDEMSWHPKSLSDLILLINLTHYELLYKTLLRENYFNEKV